MLLRLRLRTAARRLNDHGWPVTPGAYFNGERMACDRATCWATSCHPLLADWTTKDTKDLDWWAERPHAVLLPTGRLFDVIEVPALLGAKVKGVFGPIAILPSRRWLFFVRSGAELRSELQDHTDIVLHADESWVPAPPTMLAEGAVRWHLSPQHCAWQLPDPHSVQQAMVGGLVTLDASFLELPPTARRRSLSLEAASHSANWTPALRRAA